MRAPCAAQTGSWALASFVHAKLAGVEGSSLSDLLHDAPLRDRPLASCTGSGHGSPKELTPEAQAKLHKLLASLPKGDTYDPTECPQWMWKKFAELLPKGHLKRCLQGLPHLVEVVEGRDNKWQFRMLDPGAAAPGDGVDAAAPGAGVAQPPPPPPPPPPAGHWQPPPPQPPPPPPGAGP